MGYDTTSKLDTDNKASEPTIISPENCVSSDIDTVYPKSIATEFDSTEVGQLPNSESKNDDDGKGGEDTQGNVIGRKPSAGSRY